MKKHILDKKRIETQGLVDTKNGEENQNLIGPVKKDGLKWVDTKILEKNKTFTKPGSISHLLHGPRRSEQSINIQFGYFGEFLAKEIIKLNPSLELLPCGVQNINSSKKKDIDLIFQNKETLKIHGYELKSNIELDTEKVIATINKCDEIKKFLKIKYPESDVDYRILNWSVYSRRSLTSGLNHIKTFENSGIKIDHMGDFLELIDIKWDENDYDNYFKDIGKIILRV